MRWPGPEGAQGGVGREDGTALGREAELLFLWQKSHNKQEAGVAEVWGGGGYFPAPIAF